MLVAVKKQLFVGSDIIRDIIRDIIFVPNCLLRIFDLVTIQCHLVGVVYYLYKVTSVTLACFLRAVCDCQRNK